MAGTTDEQAKRIRRLKRAGLLAALLVAVLAGCRAISPPGRTTVFVDGRSLAVDVADTPQRRERGLQGYEDLPHGRGMLLVNDAPQPVSIEMKSVPFAIDVAFVDSQLRVFKVETLYPDAAREASTSGPALYVLETPEGWLGDNGLGVGSSLAFLGGGP